MSGYRDWASPSEEHQPVTYWGGHAVYAAHFVMAVFALSTIVTTVLKFAGVGHLLNWLVFSSALVLHGEVWRIVTFGLVNDPSIPFAIDLVMLVWFGREVEKFLGRGKFLAMFAGSYLVTPLLLTALGPIMPTVASGKIGALAVFIGFAALYPSVPVFFNLLAKWAALILLGIYTLMALAYRDTVLLLSIWGSCGFAFAYVRYQQGFFTLPRFRLFSRRPRLRVLPDPAPRTPLAVAKPMPENTMAEVDALLDKIAKSGIGSLTAKERARLESAREGLMKRGAGRG